MKTATKDAKATKFVAPKNLNLGSGDADKPGKGKGKDKNNESTTTTVADEDPRSSRPKSTGPQRTIPTIGGDEFEFGQFEDALTKLR